jgi:hypothetical protein
MKTLASELSYNQLMFTSWGVRTTQVSVHEHPECERLVAHLLDSEILSDELDSSNVTLARVLC